MGDLHGAFPAPPHHLEVRGRVRFFVRWVNCCDEVSRRSSWRRRTLSLQASSHGGLRRASGSHWAHVGQVSRVTHIPMQVAPPHTEGNSGQCRTSRNCNTDALTELVSSCFKGHRAETGSDFYGSCSVVWQNFVVRGVVDTFRDAEVTGQSTREHCGSATPVPNLQPRQRIAVGGRDGTAGASHGNNGHHGIFLRSHTS